MAIEDGMLKLGDARFAIGMSRSVDDKTSSSDTSAGGVFDLTKKYRITIEYADWDGTETKEFQIFVDTTRQVPVIQCMEAAQEDQVQISV